MKWRDITSYSKTDTERAPSTIELSPRAHPALRVVVTRLHGVPDQWFCCLRGLDFRDGSLVAKDLNDAKLEAIIRVRQQLRSAMEFLGEALEQAKEERSK